MKKCTKCKIIKKIINFHKSKGFKDNHSNWCKSCMKKYNKEWRKNPKVKEKEKINNRNYFNRNRERCLLRNRIWKRKNRLELNKYRKQYEIKRKQTDINYVILHNLRNRLYIAVKNNYKFGSTMKLLGCSINYFKRYLMAHFLKGMNWKNYGRHGWHIDHIKPCYLFDLTKEKEQQECFHYTNLRPLWEYENCSRNNCKANKETIC